jgi:DNA invertase Pin-like site-specific DNA recombinase
MFSIPGSLAQFENELRKERCEEGRQAALSRGVRFGAPKKLQTNQVEEMREKTKGRSSYQRFDEGIWIV